MWAITEIMGEENYDVETNIPLAETVFQMFRAVERALDDEADTEDIVEAYTEIAVQAGRATGLPIEQAKNITIGGMKIAEGEVLEGGRLVVGFSPKVAKGDDE